MSPLQDDCFPFQTDIQLLYTGIAQPCEPSTEWLAEVLTARSGLLYLCMFSGLVDASNHLQAEQKQKQKQKQMKKKARKLTWIKVEPGAS